MADAVIGACRGVIERQAELLEMEKPTGPFSDLVKEGIVKRATEQAVFRITQSRARDCSASGGLAP